MPIAILGLVTFFFLNPPRPDYGQRDQNGGVIFPEGRPQLPAKNTPSSNPVETLAFATYRRQRTHDLSKWWRKKYEELMSWDQNPWKRKLPGLGSHYFALLKSDDPADQAELAELQKRAQELYEKLLERYPELAIEYRDVAPENNGFLKWLEFQKKMDGLAGGDYMGKVKLPDFLSDEKNWDSAAARNWLAANSGLMDEIRDIGLMPERSSAGVPVQELFFTSARLAKSAADALLMEARVAAEDGNGDAALRSVRAARGLGQHVGDIESATLLGETVEVLLDLGVQETVLTQILPSLPEGQRDLAAWEEVTIPEPRMPADFADLMRGEGSVVTQNWILPIIVDPADPHSPPDPASVLDAHSLQYLAIQEHFQGTTSADWATVSTSALNEPDFSHLSYEGEELLGALWMGGEAWNRGLMRAEAITAMNRAAFAIMRGEAEPHDPIYGQPYQWNAGTRELSAPATPEFEEFRLDPVTVPLP